MELVNLKLEHLISWKWVLSSDHCVIRQAGQSSSPVMLFKFPRYFVLFSCSLFELSAVC